MTTACEYYIGSRGAQPQGPGRLTTTYVAHFVAGGSYGRLRTLVGLIAACAGLMPEATIIGTSGRSPDRVMRKDASLMRGDNANLRKLIVSLHVAEAIVRNLRKPGDSQGRHQDLQPGQTLVKAAGFTTSPVRASGSDLVEMRTGEKPKWTGTALAWRGSSQYAGLVAFARFERAVVLEQAEDVLGVAGGHRTRPSPTMERRAWRWTRSGLELDTIERPAAWLNRHLVPLPRSWPGRLALATVATVVTAGTLALLAGRPAAPGVSAHPVAEALAGLAIRLALSAAHELGHAVGLVHYGRRPRRAGFGFYLGGISFYSTLPRPSP